MSKQHSSLADLGGGPNALLIDRPPLLGMYDMIFLGKKRSIQPATAWIEIRLVQHDILIQVWPPLRYSLSKPFYLFYSNPNNGFVLFAYVVLSSPLNPVDTQSTLGTQSYKKTVNSRDSNWISM